MRQVFRSPIGNETIQFGQFANQQLNQSRYSFDLARFNTPVQKCYTLRFLQTFWPYKYTF